MVTVWTPGSVSAMINEAFTLLVLAAPGGKASQDETGGLDEA